MTLTADTIMAELARAAELETVDPDDELFDLGIDSVQFMTLVRRWRESRPELAFEDVAGARTVRDLLQRLAADE